MDAILILRRVPALNPGSDPNPKYDHDHKEHYDSRLDVDSPDSKTEPPQWLGEGTVDKCRKVEAGAYEVAVPVRGRGRVIIYPE